MRRLLIALYFTLGIAAPAHAVSLHDLIDLSRAGLSDDILIALVESERSVFHLTPEDLKQLKAQGLSDRLLLHLLQTPAIREEAARVAAFERRLEAASHTPPPAPAPPSAAEPEVIVIDRVETIAVPVYVPVPYWGYPDSPGRGPKAAAPVYWGYGGKRRPDSWKPSEKERDRR